MSVLAKGIVGIDRSHRRIVGIVDSAEKLAHQAGTNSHLDGRWELEGCCSDSFAAFGGRDCHLVPQGHLPKS